jgi:predicted RNA binding protein YcfA (HicA-like mRNA interferase family)
MSKTDKFLAKLKNGTISAAEARTLLNKMGWSSIRTKGSHEHFGKDGKVITLSPHSKELKRYQIKQIQEALEV